MPDLKCSRCPLVADALLMRAHVEYVHAGEAQVRAATLNEYKAWQAIVMLAAPEIDQFE